MTGGSRPKKVGDLVEDPHITCLDTFSLSPVQVSHSPTPLEAFCQIPADNPRREVPPTVSLAPGLDVCDFYNASERSEVWVNNQRIECLVPQLLMGWEFYSLLRPEPEGSSPVLLNPESNTPIELLFGRPPGAQQCPSMLFIIVPDGQQYDTPETPATSSRRRRSSLLGVTGGRALGNSTPYNLEKASENIDDRGCSKFPRLLALCPTHVYDDHVVLPEGNSWGLFVGPRHRSLVLLNKHRGRIDVHLLMLFSSDAVFWRGQDLIDATARLYEPFGTEEQAKNLFADFDPLKAHCGLTNALIPEHIDTNLDGRDDFKRYLNIWPPCFFVSNCSDNLRFLTPAETRQHRSGNLVRELPIPRRLEDYPKWSAVGGETTPEQRKALRQYRADVMPRSAPGVVPDKWSTGVLQLLGLHTSGGEDSWSKMVGKFGGCAEMTFAGTEIWHEPMSYIVDTKKDTRRKTQVQEYESEALFPTLGKLMQADDSASHSINWRHTQDLIPGAAFEDDEQSSDAPSSGGSGPRRVTHQRWSVWSAADSSFTNAPAPATSRHTQRSSARSSIRQISGPESSYILSPGRTSHVQNEHQALLGIPETGMSDAQAATLQAPT